MDIQAMEENLLRITETWKAYNSDFEESGKTWVLTPHCDLAQGIAVLKRPFLGGILLSFSFFFQMDMGLLLWMVIQYFTKYTHGALCISACFRLWNLACFLSSHVSHSVAFVNTRMDCVTSLIPCWVFPVVPELTNISPGSVNSLGTWSSFPSDHRQQFDQPFPHKEDCPHPSLL